MAGFGRFLTGAVLALAAAGTLAAPPVARVEPEWGAIRERAGYRALKSIDSYQAVKDGGKYPAVLLTTGVTDPRVAPFHPAKMAARLQAASASGKPVLLRVDFDAGHGMGSTRAQQDAEAADTYAFILAQTRGK